MIDFGASRLQYYAGVGTGVLKFIKYVVIERTVYLGSTVTNSFMFMRVWMGVWYSLFIRNLAHYSSH